MGFFKNINATPRIGTIITCPDGLSIYNDTGWKKFAEKDILDILVNARVVERVDGSCVDIDDIFGEHISDEYVLYELMLRSMCVTHATMTMLPYYMREDGGKDGGMRLCTRIIAIYTKKIILDYHEIYIRGWFSSHDVIRDIFEKCPYNIEFYMNRAIKYLQKLKSAGVPYKYIDKEYMSNIYSGEDEIF